MKRAIATLWTYASMACLAAGLHELVFGPSVMPLYLAVALTVGGGIAFILAPSLPVSDGLEK